MTHVESEEINASLEDMELQRGFLVGHARDHTLLPDRSASSR